MKTNSFTRIITLCLVFFFTSISSGYSQFVEKKKDSVKVDSVKKTIKKETIKPVANNIIKVVPEATYEIPKWSYGVQLVPQFGNPVLLEISPFVAHKLGDKVLGGVGLTYALTQRSRNGTTLSANHFGARMFSQFYPTKYLFAHGELEGMSLETFTTNNNVLSTTRQTIFNMMIGAGLRYPITSKFAVQVMLLYDMNRRTAGDVSELHTNPVFRVGLTF